MIDEILELLAGPLLVELPVTIGIFLVGPWLNVGEVHAHAHGRFRRHIVFFDERLDVLDLHLDPAARRLGRLGVGRQSQRPTPSHSEVRIGNERELRPLREQIVVQNPVGIEYVLLIERQRIAILDDAADLHVGEREDLGAELLAPTLHDRLIEGLARELDDTAVGPDRARLDPVNALASIVVDDLDVRLFAPFLGKDLHSLVDLHRAGLIVAIDLAIEILRRCFRREGLGPEGKLVCGDGQPIRRLRQTAQTHE